jgi:hypothetical protein
MKNIGAALLLSILLACGQTPVPEAAQAPEPAPPPPPRDQSYRFPKEGLVSTSIAADHILGKDFLPPGNVAEYSRGGKTYTLFLISAEGEEKATMLAFDIKGQLTEPAFIADFGGYFGTLDGEPWFIFPRRRVVAGIVGLPQEEAHEAGRVFAGQLE